MNWFVDCGVVIPCLNEAEWVGPLVTAVRQQLPRVVVVDDGSTDDTSRVATSRGAITLRHEEPEGKGAALATGLRWLHREGFAWAIMMDGDGQHAPADIPKLLERATQSGAALVIGNRMDEPGSMPPVRRCVNRWLSHWISNLCGRDLPDSQCGFRLIRLDVWAGLELEATHFEVESEMLLAFIARRHRVEFVPIQVVYGGERSKIHPVRDSWRWVRWAWRSWRTWREPDRQSPLRRPMPDAESTSEAKT